MVGWAEVAPATYNIYLPSASHNQQALSLYNPSDQDVAIRAQIRDKKMDMDSKDDTSMLLSPHKENIRLGSQRVVVPAHASAAVEVSYQGNPLATGEEYSLEIMPLMTRALSRSSLTILTTQKVNVHILPETIHPGMSVQYKEGHAILRNTGNISIWVQSLQACNQEHDCAPVSIGSQVRFFPGSWLDLGAMQPAAGFILEQVWGSGAGKEETQTIHL